MVRMIAMAMSMALVCVWAAGCASFKATVPEDVSWGQPPPTANIPPANVGNLSDLRRENQQLRERIDYLENQNRKQASKARDLDSDVADLQKEIDALHAQIRQYSGGRGN